MLAMEIQRPLAKAGDAGKDLVGALRPRKGPRVLVVLVEVLLDRALECRSAPMRAALDRLLGEHSEPSLDEVQPRALGGSEVQVVARPLGEPGLDRGRLVCG